MDPAQSDCIIMFHKSDYPITRDTKREEVHFKQLSPDTL